MIFTRRLNRENVFFKARFFKFGDLLGEWKLATNTKFQLSI